MRAGTTKRRVATVGAVVAGIVATTSMIAAGTSTAQDASREGSTGCRFLDGGIPDVAFPMAGLTADFRVGDTVRVAARDVPAADVEVRVRVGPSVRDATVVASGRVPGPVTYTFERATTSAFVWETAPSTPVRWDIGCVNVAPVLDADGDGVLDPLDWCDDTLLPDEPTDTARPNRYGTDAAGAFVDGRDQPAGVELDDTAGCSMSQIVERRGLGVGHRRYGVTIGPLRQWVESVAAVQGSAH